MPESDHDAAIAAIDPHINAMVDLNLLSYHRGMQDALSELSIRVGTRAEFASDGWKPALGDCLAMIARMKLSSAKLCHEARAKGHECDEYCPPPF